MSLQIIPATPIQRLPYDILRHIFGYVGQSDSVGPMSISQVSQRWRSIALDSPLMWRYITIWLDADITDTDSPKQHLLACAYLKRSQNVSIALTIHASRHFETQEMEELIQQHSHRIRSLYIKASEGSVSNLLWMQIGTIMPIPRLEVFETVIADFSHFSIRVNPKTIANENIIPPVADALVFWNLWEPTGLTELRLDTTLLFNKPDLEEIYHALSTTCRTLQHLEYQGSLEDDGVSTGRSHLEFPELRSLALLFNNDIVPLLTFMIIPALDSLIIRDFITYPATSTPDLDEMDVDQFTFGPNRLFLAINQWTSIKNLEIYGLDMSPDDIPPPPEMLHYINALNQLESLVLYGIGVATSMAHTLFKFIHRDSLLPNLSRFLLGISEMATNNSDDLCDFLLTRRRHQLPRLQKLSINMDYLRHLSNFNRVDVLRESSKDIFIFADPQVNKFIPIKEINFLEIIM
jgi:hypothetical protein